MIWQLTSLSRLYLGGNRLTSLPSEIGQLSSLTVLSFANNPELRELPLSLGNVSELTWLWTDHTHIPGIMLDDAPLSDSLKIIAGVAQAFALRNALANALARSTLNEPTNFDLKEMRLNIPTH